MPPYSELFRSHAATADENVDSKRILLAVAVKVQWLVRRPCYNSPAATAASNRSTSAPMPICPAW